MWRKVIASLRYRSGLIEIVIASDSYRSNLIGIVIDSYTCCSMVTKWISALWDGLDWPCTLASSRYERRGTGVTENRIKRNWMSKKGRQNEHYSVIAITLQYNFTLSYNTSTLWRKVIAFDSS